MKKKRIIYGILAAVWMAVIFLYSSQNGTESSNSSEGVAKVVLLLLVKAGILTNTDLPAQEFIRMEGMIRTAAHFSEYFIFGMILQRFYRYFFLEKRFMEFLAPVLTGALYAITDEVHQYFVPGRAMQLSDWMVDTAGVLCGVVLFTLIFNSKSRTQKKTGKRFPV